MANKRVIWLLGIMVLYVGMSGQGTCGKQATEQIDAAKRAVEDARVAEAPAYAPDEYRSAEETLLLAQQQFDKYQYKKAESTAMVAESEARDALQKALAAKSRKEEEARKQHEEEEAARLAYNVSSLFGGTIGEPSIEEQARQALHDVHFAFDAFELADHAKSVLALNAQWLSEHPGIRVEVEGHTDERGTDEYNLALGAKRAKAVYDWLVAAGIPPNRLRTISYGESVPLDTGTDEDAYARNRRAHFAVAP